MFKGVSKKFQLCFKEVLKVFTKSFKGCSSFRKMSIVFQESFWGNSSKMLRGPGPMDCHHMCTYLLREALRLLGMVTKITTKQRAMLFSILGNNDYQCE